MSVTGTSCCPRPCIETSSVTTCVFSGSVRLQVREDGGEVAGHPQQDVLLPARHVPTGKQGSGMEQSRTNNQ